MTKGHSSVAAAFARARRRANATTKRFARNDEGVVAIEFAFLAIPFFMLMFAILELGIIFFVSSAVDNAADAAARTVRVGSLQRDYPTAQGQLDEFRKRVCSKLPGFSNCQGRLRVVMRKTAGDFNPDLSDINDPNSLQCTGPGDTVIMRISYAYPLAVSGKLTGLGNDPSGANNHIIQSTTAFRNEPFSTGPGSTCGTANGGGGGVTTGGATGSPTSSPVSSPLVSP